MKQLKPVDVTTTPEVLRLAQEVAKTRVPVILKTNSEELAVLSPVSPASKSRRKHPKTKADFKAFLSSFGSWKGNVDVDRFLKDIEQSRSLTRPPVEL